MRAFLVVVSCILGCAQPARGASAEERKSPPVFEFGAGLEGNVGLSLLDTPAPSSLELPRSERRAELRSLGGPSYGFGLFVEGRLFSRVGLHLGAGYSLENMSGEVDVGGETVEVDLEHPALVVPILLSGLAPLGPVTAFVSIGPELLLPIIPRARTEPERAFAVAATAEGHVRLSAGVGVEWRLPLAQLDLRIPISVRGRWHPGLGDELGERVRVLPSDALIFTSTPRYGASLSLGIGMFF